MRLFERTFNRIDLPIEYSNGFNPKPKISIASPLSLGIESEEEWMDIELLEKIDREGFMEEVNNILPEDIQILHSEYIEDNTPIAALITWACYDSSFLLLDDLSQEDILSKLESWTSRDEILIKRYRKKGRRKILVTENVAELMKEVRVKTFNQGKIILSAVLKTGESGTLRPKDFIDAFIEDNDLIVDPASINFKRTGQRI